MSDNDWYFLGKEKLFSILAEATRISKTKIAKIYHELEQLGFIDYDTEKEIFYEMIEE